MRSVASLPSRAISCAPAPAERTIWPLGVAYFDAVRLVIGWCELRVAFRHFRTDRIDAMQLLGETYPGRRMALLKQWQAEIRKRAPADSAS